MQGKDGHEERSYEFAKDYFKRNNISFDSIEDVLDAIKLHRDGFYSDNVIAQSLILADKLDVKESRIGEEGKKVIGNRQYAHIEDILVD